MTICDDSLYNPFKIAMIMFHCAVIRGLVLASKSVLRTALKPRSKNTR